MQKSNYFTWGRKIIAGGLAAAMIFSGMGGYSMEQKSEAKAAETAVRELVIDGSTVNTNPQTAYRGLGTVTCNNSSRLLLDYKEDQPEKYWEIMNWLFSKEKGAGLSHIKIELGCDNNTSSGAEPATKRSEEEVANVNRGAGFVFAHDALSINPDITVDMLCWGFPAWVDEAYDVSEKNGFKARYKWYKETIDAAYDVWGIKFSYVSANRNEKPIEKKWTIYLADALENEIDARYDYSEIKIVAADETDTMAVGEEMLKSKKYRDAVDVIGCHYNSYMDKNILKLNEKYGKEIWFSEGASVATDTIFGANNTTDGVTTSGTNGMLDIANRIIIGFAQSNMTLYEFQPSVASFYDGSVYYPKQLLAANHPWSGYYQVTAGMVMAMHFNNFIGKGWQYVDSGSYGDGTQSNHYITETKDNYLTAADPASGNYSTVITNDSAEPRVYQVKVSNLAAAPSAVTVWETRSPAAGESYDAGWLNPVNTLTPVQENGIYTYNVTVSPYTMVTLTTTAGQKSYAQLKEGTQANNDALNTTLALPYADSFEYSDEFLARRGGTPKYTTDQDGAFEVVTLENGSKVLMQKIDKDMLPNSWSGKNNDPVTSLGDDTWKDYSVSVDVMIDPDTNKNSDYAGICARYNCCADIAENGYWLRVYRNGKWTFTADDVTLASGQLKGNQDGKWMTLKITVLGNAVTASINGKQVAEKTISKALTNSGRIALGSSYAKNYYDNIRVNPISGGIPSINRIDDMDSRVTVSEGVSRLQSQSYVNYGRTTTILNKGNSVSLSFYGTGIQLLGKNFAGAKLDVAVDGQTVESGYSIKDSNNRISFYGIKGLAEGQHTIQVTSKTKETITLDAFEVEGASWQDTRGKATGISLGVTQAEIGYGQSLDLKPVLVGEGASDTITYTTSNANVAVVTADGILHGNGGGTATVTATTENGSSASCEVSVKELKITPAYGFKVGAGEKLTLQTSCAQDKAAAKNVTWSVSDTSKAQISVKGVVKAKKAGKVSITATTENGLKRSVAFNIKKAPSKVAFKKKKLTLKKGKSSKLKYKLPAGSFASKVTFTSNKKKVVSVTKDGEIKGKKAGKAVITVKTYNGKKARLTVMVK